jgi:hypothetical protein
MARGVATAALTLQSVLLQTMVADGTLTPARALEVCDRAIEAYQGAASTDAEKAVAAITIEALKEVRGGIAGLLN